MAQFCFILLSKVEAGEFLNGFVTTQIPLLPGLHTHSTFRTTLIVLCEIKLQMQVFLTIMEYVC